MNSSIFFYAMFALFLVGSYLDFRSSVPFVYYGMTERNPLWRDRFGYFKPGQHWLVLAIFAAAVFALKLFTSVGNQAGIIFGIIGAGRVLFSLMNEKQKKKNRALQTSILSQLATLADRGITDPTSAEVLHVLGREIVTIRLGYAYLRLFAWIRSTVPAGMPNNSEDGARMARQVVVAHAQRPSTEWFPE